MLHERAQFSNSKHGMMGLRQFHFCGCCEMQMMMGGALHDL